MTDYTLIRAKRRTMSLQLDRAGNAVVRAPYGVKKEFIDRFVDEHEDWLTRTREKQQARRLAHPEPTDEERKALIARAKEYLPMRVDYWSGIMGLTPTGLKITSARTRFGSCSGKNSLCFSWRLMQHPPEAIDYVVVHELALHARLARTDEAAERIKRDAAASLFSCSSQQQLIKVISLQSFCFGQRGERGAVLDLRAPRHTAVRRQLTRDGDEPPGQALRPAELFHRDGRGRRVEGDDEP